MDLRPAEVTSILEKEIESYRGQSALQNVGTVLTVGDGVARVWGLDECMMNELLEFTGDVRFRIELLADGWCTLHPIVVSPGDVIGLQIVPDFPGAANCERAGGA